MATGAQPLGELAKTPEPRAMADFSISNAGAVGDGAALNTKAIQTTIDQCAAAGGGTVVVPRGEFVSGALFLKPGVNIELAEGAVLKASTNIADFPVLPNVRFEGHFSEHAASLVNVDGCDHFRLTGPGMLDGQGAAYWKTAFATGRPRLCVVYNSKDVVVSGVKFTNSPSWNLHLYKCQNSVIENCRFETTPGQRAPSTDGTDIDSSQNITVKNCFYSVNDDCVCLKGNRFDPLNPDQPKSPPVEKILITDCTFAQGDGALSLGTEATVVRDVEFKDSIVQFKDNSLRKNVPMFRIKLRPDTIGQDYSDIRVHDIKLDGDGKIVNVEPTHGTKVPASKDPISRVHNITIEDVSGAFGSFGSVSGGDTAAVDKILFRNIHVSVEKDSMLNTNGTAGLKFENVAVQKAQLSKN